MIVTADHGHYLGEYGWIGKPRAPLYDVLASTPLLVWHPDSPRMGGRVDELTAAVDLYATALDALGADVPDNVHSRSLLPLLTGDADAHRDWALYGYWGSSVNVTDGRYTYHHRCNASIDAYCHSTTMMNAGGAFKPLEAKTDAEAGEFLPYTDSPVWRFTGPSSPRHREPLLFDTETDPWQETDLAGSGQEARMWSLLVDALDSLSIPDQQYERLGLDRNDDAK